MRTNYIRGLLTGAVVLFSLVYFCQHPLNNRYDEFSGLVGSNVYSIVQDREGYLWFTTNKGVSRYDGYEFVSFTVNDGLTDNEVLGAYQDNDSRIWFRTFNGRPCFYENGTFNNSQTCNFLNNVELSDLIASIYQDSKGNIWLGSKNEIVQVDPKGVHPRKVVQMRSMFFWEDDEGLKSFPGTDRYHNHTLGKDILQNINLDSFPNRIPELAIQLADENLLVAKNSSLFLATGKGKHYQFLTEIKTPVQSQILCLFEDSKKQIWIGTRTHLLMFPTVWNLKVTPSIYLRECEVTSINEDHEGSIWASTTNGVYQFESDRMKSIGETKDEVTAIGVHGGLLVAGYKSKTIIQFTYDSAQNQFIAGRTISSAAYAREIKFLDGECLVSTDVGLYLLNANSLQTTPIKYSVKGFDYMNGQLLSGTSYGAYIFTLSHIADLPLNPSDQNQKILNSRVFHILRSENSVYLISKTGVFTWDTTLKELPYLKSVAPYNISCFHSADNQLYVGTETDGIYVFEAGIITAHYTEEEGLASTDIINIFTQNNKLHVVTASGVCIMNKSGFEIVPETRSKHFRICEAIPLNGQIILGTTRGISILDLRLPEQFKINPLPILSVISQRSGNQVQRNSELEYEDNNIVFEYKRISYHPVNFSYHYRINGLDESWNTTNARSVSYKNIPPGTYTFELDYGGAAPAAFIFSIKKPYWQTTLFIISIIVIFTGLVVSAYYLLMRGYKKKTKREFEIRISIAEAEQKALRAQMNPHFIFNALNAIQNFVLKKDTDQAYTYLGQFAKLIRGTLENSRKMTATLESEVNFLKLYLNLERLRFKDQFEYHFNLDNTVNPEQLIPTMILQPFIENAIIHGLLPSKKGIINKLEINIKEDFKFLYFEIIDNGVGFSDSVNPDSGSPRNKSFGIQITRERIVLYDPSKLSTIEIIPVRGIDGLTDGTCVRLKIRKNV